VWCFQWNLLLSIGLRSGLVGFVSELVLLIRSSWIQIVNLLSDKYVHIYIYMLLIRLRSGLVGCVLGLVVWIRSSWIQIVNLLADKYVYIYICC